MAERAGKGRRKAGGEERLLALERAVRELTARLAALEVAARPGEEGPPPAPPAELAGVDLIEALRGRRGPPYERGDRRGAVLYAGAVSIGGGEYLWQVERPAPGLLALKPERIAPVLASLSSPQRLSLLGALLAGPKSSQELQEVLGVSSPGPLYHHLKELLAAGIVEQRERSAYQIVARHVVPLLAIWAAAFDLSKGA
jgi:DNA-binding transcriptional ArsR family regulator